MIDLRICKYQRCMHVLYNHHTTLINDSRLLLVCPVTNGISFASYLSENINCQLQRRFVSFSFLRSWPSALFTLLVCQLLSDSGQDGNHRLPSDFRAGVAAPREHLRYENTQLLLSRHVKSSASWPNRCVWCEREPRRCKFPLSPFDISRSFLLCAILSSKICRPTDTRWCTNGKIATLKSLSVFCDKSEPHRS